MQPSLKLVDRHSKEDMEKFLVESDHLSNLYTLTSSSRGRKRPDKISDWRTCFEIDREKEIEAATDLPITPEGMVVLYSDKIAYTCGDLEDAYKTLDEVACMTDVSLTRYFRENFMPSAVY